jgi:hypothetical protein
MYNITADRLKFHNKGRGNGYIVPMNLPYTMTPEQAAEGVLAFSPRIVYPYHFGQSDVAAFAKLVAKNPNIEVRQRTWYR